MSWTLIMRTILRSTLTIIILQTITATQVCHPAYVLGDSDVKQDKATQLPSLFTKKNKDLGFFKV